MSKILSMILKGAEQEMRDELLGLRASRVPSKMKREMRRKYAKRQMQQKTKEVLGS